MSLDNSKRSLTVPAEGAGYPNRGPHIWTGRSEAKGLDFYPSIMASHGKVLGGGGYSFIYKVTISLWQLCGDRIEI